MMVNAFLVLIFGVVGPPSDGVTFLTSESLGMIIKRIAMRKNFAIFEKSVGLPLEATPNKDDMYSCRVDLV